MNTEGHSEVPHSALLLKMEKEQCEKFFGLCSWNGRAEWKKCFSYEVLWKVMNYEYKFDPMLPFLSPGISVTVWCQGTGWPSWASTPSRRVQPQRPGGVTRERGWASALPTCVWWASTWTWMEQVVSGTAGWELLLHWFCIAIINIAITCTWDQRHWNHSLNSFLIGRGATSSVSPQEEEELRSLAASPDIYSSFSRSIAPSIYGSDDMKRAIACLLFGGSRKRWVGRWGHGCT